MFSLCPLIIIIIIITLLFWVTHDGISIYMPKYEIRMYVQEQLFYCYNVNMGKFPGVSRHIIF